MALSTLEALVHTIRYEAEHVISVELRPARPETEFPMHTAGAHIDLHLPGGLVRSYSLCNAQGDGGRYIVGVLHDRNSRGGSRYVHQQLRVGARLQISAPRNNFGLDETAPHSVLVAGGIGITPIYTMVRRLRTLGKSADLIYCARSRKEAAFAEELTELAQDGIKLTWHFDEEAGGPPDLAALLGGRGEKSHYYCCGPGPMLSSFEKTCGQLGLRQVHVERFAAETPAAAQAPANACVVELAISGRTVNVQPGESILDRLLAEGFDLNYSCKEGICGACETKVLAGEVDHRDSLLSDDEKAANKTMMICVSRCKSGKLILDI